MGPTPGTHCLVSEVVRIGPVVSFGHADVSAGEAETALFRSNDRERGADRDDKEEIDHQSEYPLERHQDPDSVVRLCGRRS